MANTSQEFIDIIRDLVQQELAKRGGVALCQIVEQKDDNHYDLIVVPDQDNIIHNVASMVNVDLKVGDYVYIYKINGQLNNAFICYKIIPFIAPASTAGDGSVINNTSTITFIMNRDHLNKNVTIDTLIKEFNTNDINKNFLDSRTSFADTQARPYYISGYGVPYWMFGKAKGTVTTLGQFGMDTTQVYTVGATFKFTNGFTLNTRDPENPVVAANVAACTLTINCLNADGASVASGSVNMAAITAGTDPDDVPEYTLTLSSADRQTITTIEFSTSVTKARFNLFTTSFEYKLAS